MEWVRICPEGLVSYIMGPVRGLYGGPRGPACVWVHDTGVLQRGREAAHGALRRGCSSARGEGAHYPFASHVRGACAPRIHIDGYGYYTYIGYAGSACVSVGDPLHFTARGFSALEECRVTQVSLVLLGGRDRELCVWILRGSLFSVESRRQARTV